LSLGALQPSASVGRTDPPPAATDAGTDPGGHDGVAGEGDSGGEGSAPSGTGPAVPADARKRYYVDVSLAEQLVRVYLDGEEVRVMVCSAGTPESPTPTGRFELQNRGEFFFSEKYQEGGKWWVSFQGWGVYLFHSVPTDRYGAVLPDEAAKLGHPASHGCIRLSMDDARWFYNTVPEKTPVDIH